ncbi:hypothetical protein NMY22_g9128 [Coprinellus aureogranulatus]|nr:hypothetical protein NMY22_g9128 [Coprinellus aureogranulatus]
MLGSVNVATLWSYRRAADDNLQYGILYTGFNERTKTRITSPLQDEELILAGWRSHNDGLLPRNNTSSISLRNRASDGLPLPPAIDIDSATNSQLRQILEEYFAALWCTLRLAIEPGYAIHFVCHIMKDPNVDYDATLHSSPVPLRHPRDMSGAEIQTLFPFLLSRSITDSPFQFRSRSEIERHIAAAAASLQRELEKDDEEPDINLTTLVDPEGPGDLGNDETPVNPPYFPVTLDSDSSKTTPSEGGRAKSKPKKAAQSKTKKLAPSFDPKKGKCKEDHQPSTHSGKDSRVNTAIDAAALPPPNENTQTGTLQASSGPPSARRSTRDHKQAVIGVQLVAGGMRSPEKRQAHWLYPDGRTEAVAGKGEPSSEATSAGPEKKRRKVNTT